MKIIIKKGVPYKQHKCSKCKTIYVYHLQEDVLMNDMVYCPVCGNYSDLMLFDKKISNKKYQKLEKESDVK